MAERPVPRPYAGRLRGRWAFLRPRAAVQPSEERGRLSLLRARYEAGVWAVPLALAPGFALSALLGVPTPLEPLTELVMQTTPVSLANILLGVLGPFARMAALLGAVALTLPAGALLALVCGETVAATPDGESGPHGSRVGHRLHWVATVVLALAAVAPLALGSAYAGEASAALLCGIAFVPALALTRRLQYRLQRSGRTDEPATGPSRRAVLRGMLGSGATVGAALTLGAFDVWSGALGSLLGRDDASRALFAYTPPRPRAAGFPVAGLEPEVTSVGRFYLLSKNDVDPVIQPDAWFLRVSGAVSRPYTLSYAALLALPRADGYVTLRCVDNPPGGHLMSTAYWSGVPLAMLLDHARVAADAASIVLRAPDAYAEVIPLDAARDPAALLAYGINGQTLPRRHGGPVRALLPGYFGFKNVKWVTAIEVSRAAVAGYWAQRGWIASQVHSIARIDVWRQTDGGVLVAGVGFGGARGVSAVQVRDGAGPWQNAVLNAPALSPQSWVQWRATLSLAPGAHTLAARVIDGLGQAQAATSADVFPNGATGLDTIQVTV